MRVGARDPRRGPTDGVSCRTSPGSALQDPTPPTRDPGASHPAPHPGRASGAELWLVRHAEVHGDWRGRAYGDLDVPLSAAGEARSRELAPRLAELRPTVLLASPLARARALGELVAESSGLALRTVPDLREIHRGDWQGRLVKELVSEDREDVASFYANPWEWRGHGGEADRELRTRAWRALEPYLEEDARLVVLTHYNVIRVLIASALGSDPASSFALRVDPGRVCHLRDGPHGWELHATNLAEPRTETTA